MSTHDGQPRKRGGRAVDKATPGQAGFPQSKTLEGYDRGHGVSVQ